MKSKPTAVTKAVLRTLSVFVLIPLLLFGGWAVWERNRDALGAVDFHPGQTTLSQDAPYALADAGLHGRKYRRILLSTEHTGSIEAFVSRPETIPLQGLPVVIIMGGLEIDAEDFRLITEPGENIYVIFKYPYSPRYWYEGAPAVELPVIRRSVLKVPSQALSLYSWVCTQPWAQQGRVTFVGFSFGSMFLPAIYHLAQSRHAVLNPGVIAYGGVDIYDLLYTNMDQLQPPWRSLAAWLGETAIYGIEPARHLPWVKNEFLLINGTRDHQVSTYSSKLLHTLAPEPKTVMILDEGHMHPGNPELTEKLVKICREWLLERGLVN